jgi:hypothetical protein
VGRKHEEKEGKQGRPIVSGFIYLGLGLFLLLVGTRSLEDTWPILIIIVGIALIVGAMFKGKRHSKDTPSPPPSPTASLNQ